MMVFVDFEASSLGKRGFPVEVGWAAEDGGEESHLIRPAPDWDAWDAAAERIHGISIEELRRDGEPHEDVARRLTERLTGHALYASAPSWDGQWLSKLLRAAGLPRHALRLHDTEDAHRLAADTALAGAGVPAGARQDLVAAVIAEAHQDARQETPAHRALADARRERRLWRDIGHRASVAAASWAGA